MLSLSFSVTPPPPPTSLSLVQGCDEDDLAIYRVNVGPVRAEWLIYFYTRIFHSTEGWKERSDQNVYHHWQAELYAVSPGFATDKALCTALGDEAGQVADIVDDAAFIETVNLFLIDSGIRATLATKSSRRVRGPLKGIAMIASTLDMPLQLSCSLDRRVNALGNTGWEAMAGRIGWGGCAKKVDDVTEDQARLIARVNSLFPDRYQEE